MSMRAKADHLARLGLALYLPVTGIAAISNPPPAFLAAWSGFELHTTGFFVLTLLARLAFGSIQPLVLLGMLLTGGAALEALQHLVGRDAELADMGANAIGGLLALCASFFIARLATLRRTHPERP